MDETAAAASCYTEDPSTSVRNQYVAGIIVCLGTFSYGSALGWVSPSLQILQGADSPLGAALTGREMSAVASLFCVGGLLGSLGAGALAERLGRRRTGLILAVPAALCWTLKLAANSVTLIYFARVLAGIGGGGSLLLAPMYSIEIASLAVRGSVGSLTMFTVNSGVLFIFVIGAYLPYNVVLWLNLAVPIIYFIGLFFMPETPTFLVKGGKYEEAAKSIAWLRNTTTEDPVTVGVLENLKREALLALNTSQKSDPTNPNAEDVREEKTIATFQAEHLPDKDIPDWKFFITSRISMKAFGLCLTLIFIHVWVGAFSIVSFVSDIFADAGSSLSPNNAAIVVAIVQLAGICVTALVIDRLGRKIIFISSCIVLGLALATLGFYFHFKIQGHDMTPFGWIPVVALSLGIFMEAVGIGPIPFVIINEVFMIQASGIAITIINIWLWLMLALQTQFYKAAEEAMGSDVLFWAFMSVCVFGAAYTVGFVPETRGKTLDEILQHFDGGSKKAAKDANPKMGADNVVNVDDELRGYHLSSF